MKKMLLFYIFYIPLPIFALQAVKLHSCFSCHGSQGMSTNPKWPNIAGQHPQYFIKQLLDYKNNQSRPSKLMSKALSEINEEEMHDLAAYYAKMPIIKNKPGQKPTARGKKIYQSGDYEKGINACVSCHGPLGTGNAQAGFPVLKGQNALYLMSQLQEFKSGKRSNDLGQVMRFLCSKMDDKDMEAVAYYIESLN